MQCAGCQKELPPRTEVCPSCSAINPQNVADGPNAGEASAAADGPPPGEAEALAADDIAAMFAPKKKAKRSPAAAKAPSAPAADEPAVQPAAPAARAVPAIVQEPEESAAEPEPSLADRPLPPPPAPPARPAPSHTALPVGAPAANAPLKEPAWFRRVLTPVPKEGPAGPDAIPDDPAIGATATALLTSWIVDLSTICMTDTILVGTVYLLLGGPSLAPAGWSRALLTARGLPLLWIGTGACLSILYSTFFLSAWGRTPGQQLAGFRLLRDGSGRPGPAVAFLHAVLELFSLFAGAGGFTWALIDPRGQTLHGRICRLVPRKEPR